MPVYATVTDLENLISKAIMVQLTDDSEIGQVNDAVSSLHLDNAEGEVNAALSAAGYTVPVALPIPAGAGIIKAATLWLAVCGLAARRGVIPEDYKSQCEYFHNVLEKISAGELLLPLPSSTGLPRSSTEDQEKIFTRSKYDHSGNVINSEEQGSLDVV
jgi:phage gp36-like protein